MSPNTTWTISSKAWNSPVVYPTWEYKLGIKGYRGSMSIPKFLKNIQWQNRNHLVSESLHLWFQRNGRRYKHPSNKLYLVWWNKTLVVIWLLPKTYHSMFITLMISLCPWSVMLFRDHNCCCGQSKYKYHNEYIVFSIKVVFSVHAPVVSTNYKGSFKTYIRPG